MSPDSQGIFIEEALIVLYCTPTIVHLTCHLQVCRPQESERQNATWPRYNSKRSINHQPATNCYSIPFSSWWNDNLMLTMICRASHRSDEHIVNCDAQNLQRTPCVNGDPPFLVEPSYLMIPTVIQVLFTVAWVYLRQCAHISIVDCRVQRMMVVGYNGFLFQDVGFVAQACGTYISIRLQ